MLKYRLLKLVISENYTTDGKRNEKTVQKSRSVDLMAPNMRSYHIITKSTTINRNETGGKLHTIPRKSLTLKMCRQPSKYLSTSRKNEYSNLTAKRLFNYLQSLKIRMLASLSKKQRRKMNAQFQRKVRQRFVGLSAEQTRRFLLQRQVLRRRRHRHLIIQKELLIN